MYLFAGLPLDSQTQHDHVVSLLGTFRPDAQLLNIPAIPIKNFSSLVLLSSDLSPLDTLTSDLLQQFIHVIQEYTADAPTHLRMNFDFSSTKTICEVHEELLERANILKNSVTQRLADVQSTMKALSFCEKVLHGGVQTIDVIPVEHEFLSEHYILVPAQCKKEFIKFLQNTEGLSSDACEVYLSDSEHTIFKLICLKAESDSVKDILTKNGWIIKKPSANVGENNLEELRCEYETTKSNFCVYLKTNVDDVLSLFLQSKMLRLYCESVLAYGLGPIVFFCVEDVSETKLLCFLRKVTTQWELSQRFTPDGSLDDVVHLILQDPIARVD